MIDIELGSSGQAGEVLRTPLESVKHQAIMASEGNEYLLEWFLWHVRINFYWVF